MMIGLKDLKFITSTCAICLDSIKNEQKCRILSCFHVFHAKCITGWLIKASSCPNCKKEFTRKLDIEFEREKQPMENIEVDYDCFYSDHITREVKGRILTKVEKNDAIQMKKGNLNRDLEKLTHRGRSNSFCIYETIKITRVNTKDDFGIEKDGFLKLYD